MTTKSRLLAGSIGKTFVPPVALALQTDGRLRLDDRIQTWLGEESWFERLPNGHDITLSHLLSHSSGLTDHVYDERYAETARQRRETPGVDPDDSMSREDLVTFVLDKEPLFPAGEGFHYTDTGYILAGLVIELASERTFYEEVRHRFLDPLDLHRTDPSDRRSLEGLVAGYCGEQFTSWPEKMAENGVMAYNPASECTGGGFVSNSQDLVPWVKELYEGRVLDFPYLDDLLESGYRGADAERTYGLAVYHFDDPPGRRIGHGGYFPGYNSSMYYFPAPKIAVAVQINSSDGNLRGPVMAGIAEVALAAAE